MNRPSPNPDTIPSLPAERCRPAITVGHVITGLNIGGAENDLFKLVCGTDPRKFRHVVVSLSEIGAYGEQLRARGFEVHHLNIIYAKGFLRACWSMVAGFMKLVKILRRVKPQILHCWMYHSNFLGFFAAKMSGVPRVVFAILSSDLNLSEFRRATRWTMQIGAWLSRFVDVVVFNSQAGQKFSEKWGSHPRRSMIIFNGFNTEVFKPDAEARFSVRRELGLSDDSILIGVMAHLRPMKDYPGLMQAAKILLETRPETHFLFAGLDVTPDQPIFAGALQSDLFRGKLHLLGPRGDAARIDAALDILCSSSSYGEGLSNSVGEAMSAGTPCVVTDVGDSAFVVGDSGLAVPPNNPPALAEALRKMVDMSQAQRKELRDKARKRIAKNFTIDKFVANYEALYLKLCPQICADDKSGKKT